MTPESKTLEALEFQIGRLVSDRDSDKVVYREIHREIHMELENLKKAVFGSEETIGLRPRVLQMEEVVKEVRHVVGRLEKAFYLCAGAFAIVKLALEIFPKHLAP